MERSRTTEQVRAAIVEALIDMSKAEPPFHAVKIIRKHRLSRKVSSALAKIGAIETGRDGSRLTVQRDGFEAAAAEAHQHCIDYARMWARQHRAKIKAARKPPSPPRERIIEEGAPSEYNSSENVPKVRLKIGRMELRW